jgi:hypothetical protein
MARQLKLIFILSLFTFNTFAGSAYSVELSSIKFGKLQYALLKIKSDWYVIKNTNLFDKRNDLGQFKITNTKEILPLINDLHHLESALKKIEARVGLQSKSLNGFQHQRYYSLGGYNVDRNDSYFKDVTQVFNKIHKLIKYEHTTGIELISHKEKLIFNRFKNSKIESNKSYRKDDICKKGNRSELICVHKSFGTLYL